MISYASVRQNFNSLGELTGVFIVAFLLTQVVWIVGFIVTLTSRRKIPRAWR
jgi:fucose permease